MVVVILAGDPRNEMLTEPAWQAGLDAGGWGKDDLRAAVSLRSSPTEVGKTFRGKWGCVTCLAVVCISLSQATFCRGGHVPLCPRWPPLLGTAGTCVTQGQQPGLSFGKKAGLGTGCYQTFSLALAAVTDRFATSLREDMDRMQKQILFGSHVQT